MEKMRNILLNILISIIFNIEINKWNKIFSYLKDNYYKIKICISHRFLETQNER